MRRIGAVVILCGGVLATTARGAAAQELTAAAVGYRSFGVGDLSGDFPPAAELRLTLPLSTPVAVEPFASIRWPSPHAPREGFLGVQLHQRIGRGAANADLFAVYGTAIYLGGDETRLPIFGHVGFAAHQRIAPRVAFRPELQVVPFTSSRSACGLSPGWPSASELVARRDHNAVSRR